MSLLNLPRAVSRRETDVRAFSPALVDELRVLIPTINTALAALDLDHRCHVRLAATQSIDDGDTTELLWERPPSWPNGDPYQGYDTGLLDTSGTRTSAFHPTMPDPTGTGRFFIPTKEGLYFVSANVEWESSATIQGRNLFVIGAVNGVRAILARAVEVSTASIQRVKLVLPFIPVQGSEGRIQTKSYLPDGVWSIAVSHTHVPTLNIVKGDNTWAQVVRLR